MRTLSIFCFFLGGGGGGGGGGALCGRVSVSFFFLYLGYVYVHGLGYV